MILISLWWRTNSYESWLDTRMDVSGSKPPFLASLFSRLSSWFPFVKLNSNDFCLFTVLFAHWLQRVNSNCSKFFFCSSSSSSNCYCICVPNVCLHICCCRKWIIGAVVCVWVTHSWCANSIVPAERHSVFENGDDTSQMSFTACVRRQGLCLRRKFETYVKVG